LVPNPDDYARNRDDFVRNRNDYARKRDGLTPILNGTYTYIYKVWNRSGGVLGWEWWIWEIAHGFNRGITNGQHHT